MFYGISSGLQELVEDVTKLVYIKKKGVEILNGLD